ncbi:MAG: M1 family metallopeptidase [Chitinophagaceae bacterium]|nr:M1 family metallopeptidase [Chitinophagaceae bacterium]
MYKWLFVLSVFVSIDGISQTNYWQQEVNYRIDVTLNDQAHSLHGNIAVDYLNHSPDTLHYIWFHLWPNAYKNDKTALAKQLTADRTGRKSFRNKEAGWIDSLNFEIDGRKVIVEPHPEHIDVVKLLLSVPLLPGSKTQIKTPFVVKLPEYFSRSGHDGQQYFICQWYPKPAVYDKKGWHPMPYLDQGEFYSEYGSFDVTISLPADYVVGATGILQTRKEFDLYKTIGAANYRDREAGPVHPYQATATAQLKRLNYTASNVHDFAWFADKDFVIQYDTLLLPSGKITDVFSFYQPNGNKEWRNSISFIEDAVTNYSAWLGEYPYPAAQAVEGPKNASSGGMEYPMITLITSPDEGREGLDAVITHEVGHNWFYGILGTNERDHPWMDEGLNTFYQFRYEATKYRSNAIFGKEVPNELKSLSVPEFLDRIFGALNNLPAKKAINTSSTAFANKDEYGIVVYIKTAVWLYIVQNSVGQPALDKAMHNYFDKWKFRHPYPEDLKAALEESIDTNLNNLFELLDKQGNFK